MGSPRTSGERDPHGKQPDIEDIPYTHYQVMTEALSELLIEKDLVTRDEFRAQLELMDTKGPMNGAQMIARAWIEPSFKARMLVDVNAAATDMGLDAGHIPIRCVENTPERHNVIVCTLCSCYPRFLIGLPPDWYKSRAYRSRTIREPREVLKEFGTHIPEEVEVRVHDSTADLRYMVLPMRPEGTENLKSEELARLVTRDSMIGVTILNTYRKE